MSKHRFQLTQMSEVNFHENFGKRHLGCFGLSAGLDKPFSRFLHCITPWFTSRLVDFPKQTEPEAVKDSNFWRLNKSRICFWSSLFVTSEFVWELWLTFDWPLVYVETSLFSSVLKIFLRWFWLLCKCHLFSQISVIFFEWGRQTGPSNSDFWLHAAFDK